MSEKDILSDLLEWLEKYPERLAQYKNLKYKKYYAKKLLQFRLSIEPGYLYLLPITLLEKIGIQYFLNPRVSNLVENLAKSVKGKVTMAFKI